MMSRLYDVLVEKFGFAKLPGEDGFYRRWERDVEVAWMGIHREEYMVRVYPVSSDTVLAFFSKDGQCVKQKYYSYGCARTLRAIEETVKYAGFEWETVGTENAPLNNEALRAHSDRYVQTIYGR